MQDPRSASRFVTGSSALALAAISVTVCGLFLSVLAPSIAQATTNCSFVTSGKTMSLVANCTTDETIPIPDSFTVDGAWHTIRAVNPPSGHFKGAILQNAGTTASVRRIRLTASVTLPPGCHTVTDEKLRGIALLNAGGAIADVEIVGLNGGVPSVCDEGSGIVANSAPFDGTHPNTKTVSVSNASITDFAKVGVQFEGDIVGRVSDSRLSGLTGTGIPPNGQFALAVLLGGRATFEDNLVTQAWSSGQPDVDAVFVTDTTGTVVRDNFLFGGREGVFVSADCGFSTTGNTISHNVLKQQFDAIVLTAPACAAHVDRNVVSDNFLTATNGSTGVFVGAQSPGTADRNRIIDNCISGFTNPIVRSGDTNTIVDGNR